MNDRYLFRGKRLNNGEWVQGHYRSRTMEPNFDRVRHFISMDYPEMYEIDETTLGQCTGLKETCVNGEYKEGDLIFVGDIITVSAYSYTEPEADYFGVVEIGPFGYGLHVYDGYNRKKWINLCDCQGSYITHYTKYGNIHDNPELLEEDELFEEDI